MRRNKGFRPKGAKMKRRRPIRAKPGRGGYRM